MKLDKNQCIFVANKLMDSANVVLLVLVIGQLAANKTEPLLLLLGVLIYFWCWSVSVGLIKGVKSRDKS